MELSQKLLITRVTCIVAFTLPIVLMSCGVAAILLGHVAVSINLFLAALGSFSLLVVVLFFAPRLVRRWKGLSLLEWKTLQMHSTWLGSLGAFLNMLHWTSPAVKPADRK